eukprot:g70908.t1
MAREGEEKLSDIADEETKKPEASKSSLRNLRRKKKREAIREAKAAEATSPIYVNSGANLLSIPYQVMVGCVISFLDNFSVATLARTSRRLRNLSKEGLFWRDVFKRKYPLSALNPSSIADWKTAYMIERKEIAESRFTCFVNQQSFFETTLGMPVTFTVNPKTRCADYILCHTSLLSQTAYDKGVRRTPADESFSLLLPLYFSDTHFRKALPQIESCLVKLSPQLETRRFHLHMVLSVLPAIMNTFVVLFSDKGLAASKASFQGFMWIHRLFIELVREYGLEREVESRTHRFIIDPKSRVKQALPSLGNFIPLVSVSEKYKFCDIAPAYLRESMTRSVLWIAKEFPDFASPKREFDQQRPSWAFEGCKIMSEELMRMFREANISEVDGKTIITLDGKRTPAPSATATPASDPPASDPPTDEEEDKDNEDTPPQGWHTYDTLEEGYAQGRNIRVRVSKEFLKATKLAGSFSNKSTIREAGRENFFYKTAVWNTNIQNPKHTKNFLVSVNGEVFVYNSVTAVAKLGDRTLNIDWMLPLE